MGQNNAFIFDTKKYALVHFVNIQEVDPPYTPLSLEEHIVAATRTGERYLGYWLDSELEFDHHRERRPQRQTCLSKPYGAWQVQRRVLHYPQCVESTKR